MLVKHLDEALNCLEASPLGYATVHFAELVVDHEAAFALKCLAWEGRLMMYHSTVVGTQVINDPLIVLALSRCGLHRVCEKHTFGGGLRVSYGGEPIWEDRVGQVISLLLVYSYFDVVVSQVLDHLVKLV